MINDAEFTSDDPPTNVTLSGDKEWCQDSKLHRVFGPAVEYDGIGSAWYRHGMQHSLEGPAIDFPENFQSWMVRDRALRLDGPCKIYANGNVVWST